MNNLSDLAKRRMLDELALSSAYTMPNEPDNQLSSLIDSGQNFIRNDTTGRVIDLPQGQAQPRFTGSPVDVFGQGKGYLDPSSGMIRGVNPSGQQFRVQPSGMEAGKAQAMKAELENRMKMAQLKKLDMETQGGMTPADQLAREKFEWEKSGAKSAAKPMTADQETKFLERWSKDYKEVQGAMSSATELAKAAKQVGEAEGLEGATGLQAYIPSYPGSPASNAEVDIETLKGKVTSMGKALMSASGSIGPMAIQEWKIVSDAVAALDPKKLSPKKLKEQIGIIESQAQGMAERLNDVYGRQYQDYYQQYPQMRIDGQGGGTAPNSSGGWGIQRVQ